MKNYAKVLAVAGGNQITAVIENLPIEANGFFMTEDQMDRVEASLAAAETSAAELATANERIATLTTDQQAMGGQLSAATASLETANARIVELEAMGGTGSGTSATEDPNRGNVEDPMSMNFQKELLEKAG
jgi:hypothetical protein